MRSTTKIYPSSFKLWNINICVYLFLHDIVHCDNSVGLLKLAYVGFLLTIRLFPSLVQMVTQCLHCDLSGASNYPVSNSRLSYVEAHRKLDASGDKIGCRESEGSTGQCVLWKEQTWIWLKQTSLVSPLNRRPFWPFSFQQNVFLGDCYCNLFPVS